MTRAHAPSPALVEPARSAPALRATGISKTYGEQERALVALHPCDLELQRGTLTVVVGPSGSGKSTLLHVLSGLDTPTTGDVWIGERRLRDLSEARRARWRARQVGFVLQRDNLIPSLSLAENVAAPLMLAGARREDALARSRLALELVDLSHRAASRPAAVSGGEAQRAAVARACAGSPRLIFLDEPTGALDSVASAVVLALVRSLAVGGGAATLLVTHDAGARAMADVVVEIEDGRLRHAL